MKIFIAGASGAIGSQLVPELVASGHEVAGTTRSGAKTGALRALGAEPHPPADADYGWPRRATWRTG